MGQVVSNLADTDMESARVIMRRLIWNLNDESGGIGWGSPEAMGDIMACHERLAGEYHRLLVSYAGLRVIFWSIRNCRRDCCGVWQDWPLSGRSW